MAAVVDEIEVIGIGTLAEAAVSGTDPSIDWGNSGAAGLTRVFPTSEGNITANIIAVAPNSFLAVVPEPGGLLAFGVGLTGVLGLRRPARHVRDAS